MTEGTEYYQQIGQLQKALRERELHRLELEREHLARLQRREKRHDQLRSKIKALHQELIQEEIESTQRVTLLLSQVDSVRREYELLEARTERLRQKKRQFELFVTSSSQRPAYVGTSSYGAQNINDPGQYGDRLRPQPDAISAIRTSLQLSEQQIRHPLAPFYVPSFQDVYPSSSTIPASSQLPSGKAQGPMVMPYPQTAEHLNLPRMPVPQSEGNVLGPSDRNQLYYGGNSAYNSGDPAYNPQTLAKRATGDSHLSGDNFAAHMQGNRSQYITKTIPGKEQISEGIVVDEDEAAISNMNRASLRTGYQNSELEGISRNIIIADDHAFIRGPEKASGQQQPFFQPSSNLTYHAQGLSSQDNTLQPHARSGHYPQESLQPVHHPLPAPSKSHNVQTSLESTARTDFHPAHTASPTNQVTSRSSRDYVNQMEDRRIVNLHAPDASHKEEGSPSAEQVVSMRELEVLHDPSSHERGLGLEDVNYEAYIKQEEEMRNVLESLHSANEQLSHQYDSIEEEKVGGPDVQILNDVPHERQRNGVTVDNDRSTLGMRSVDDAGLQKDPDVTEADPAEEQTPEVVEADLVEEQTPEQTEADPVEETTPEVVEVDPVEKQTPEVCDSQRSSTSSQEESESVPERQEDMTPGSLDNERIVTMESDTSDDKEPEPPKRSTHGETIQSPSRDTSFSKSYPQNTANKADEDDDSDFFDREIPVTASRAYKSLVGDMSIGGPGIPTESDSDDIEGQMSALTVRGNPVKKPTFRPFASSIPSLRPKPPSTDTDSVDSVEAAIQAAMTKVKEEKPDSSDKNQEPAKVTETSSTESKPPVAKEAAPVPAGGTKPMKGKSKPSGALNLKLDSDSESCEVSGGDNDSDDDFDFYG
ncbi:protein IWS1 homolog A-like [Macrobrachium rosenbergii]|uniref:protein IWS1 homolog A-like n=1 Tax=Macrobrachium rosenbergii TaxID=79674 RepID=UPI0034D70223